jgi:hypothetical protein
MTLAVAGKGHVLTSGKITLAGGMRVSTSIQDQQNNDSNLRPKPAASRRMIPEAIV